MASSPTPIEKTVCRSCHKVLDAADRFCRYCGALVGAASGDGARVEVIAGPRQSADPPGKAGFGAAFDNPWLILALLFLVLGPVAIPMLWRSRQFSVRNKIILTVVTLGATGFGLYLAWYQVAQILKQVQDMQSGKF